MLRAKHAFPPSVAVSGNPTIYLFAVALATAALSACAVSTTEVRNSETSPVPLNRIINGPFQTPEPGDAHIIIKRDAGFFGSGCAFPVRIQGMPLTVLRPAERVDLYVKPGRYILGASEGCGQDAVIEIEAIVAAGELKTYRLELDGRIVDSAVFRFMPTTND